VSCSFTVWEKIAACAAERDERRDVDVVLHLLERVGERARHCIAGDADDVHLVLLHEAPRLLGVELVDDDRGVALARDAEDRELPGTVHERRDGQADAALRDRSVDLVARRRRSRDPLAVQRVDTSSERVVHVFLAPHHTLGQAGGPAGVEEIHVVVGALPEVTLGRSRRDRRFELDRFELRVVGIGAVPLDTEEVLELRLRVTRRGNDRPVLALVHERHEIGVVEQVAHLLFDVAEVDVHDPRPDLVDPYIASTTRCSSWRGCRRDPRLHPRVLQRVREAGRPLVELRYVIWRRLSISATRSGTLSAGHLEQVREVVVPLNVCHRSEGRTRSNSSQNEPA
jgi:hypothetical protein